MTTEVSPAILAAQQALFAPHLFAILGATLLTGAFFSEAAAFSAHHDPLSPKRRVDVGVVRSLLVLSLGLFALDCYILYDITVIHAADLPYSFTFHPAEFVEPLLASFAGTISQMWFAERAYKLVNKSKWFLVVVSSLLLTTAAAGIADIIVCMLAWGTVHGWMKEVKITAVWLCSSCATDVVITAVLIWKVRELVAFTGDAPKQQRPFSHLVRLSFATGALTALAAGLGAATYLALWETSNAWLVPALWLPRLSSLSCVVTINLRSRWRMHGQVVDAHDLGVVSTLYLRRAVDDEEMQEHKPALHGSPQSPPVLFVGP